MAKNKLIINGEQATFQIKIRTTKFILDQFTKEAENKMTSVNLLVNKALLPIALKFKEKNNGKK